MANKKKLPFHLPTDLGVFPVASGSEDVKTMNIALSQNPRSNPKIVAHLRGKVLKTYEIGSGLNLDDPSTLIWSFRGSDFKALSGDLINVECSLYGLGDVNLSFKLEVIKTFV